MIFHQYFENDKSKLIKSTFTLPEFSQHASCTIPILWHILIYIESSVKHKEVTFLILAMGNHVVSSNFLSPGLESWTTNCNLLIVDMSSIWQAVWAHVTFWLCHSSKLPYWRDIVFVLALACVLCGYICLNTNSCFFNYSSGLVVVIRYGQPLVCQLLLILVWYILLLQS